MTTVNIKLPEWDAEGTDQETIYFLASLLNFEQPEVVVEAGTYRGHFAIMAATVLPNSRVFTSDPVDWGLPQMGNLFYFQTDFEEMLSGLKPRSVDFAFIDSGCPPGQTLDKSVRWRHYQAVKPYMAKDGIIAVHDMNATDWYNAGKILADSDLYLQAGRGLTLEQLL